MTPLAWPLRLTLELAALGAVLGGLWWGWTRFIEHERAIGRAEVRAEVAQQLAAAQQAALVREQALVQQRDAAVAERDQHEQTIRRMAAGAGAASVGLRDALADIVRRVPDAPDDALRHTTTALSAVLADCQGRYRALAEAADRHVNDTRALSSAWPQ